MPLAGSASDLKRRAPDLAALEDFYDAAGFGAGLRRQAERITRRSVAQ
jgi:hypothetical protein